MDEETFSHISFILCLLVWPVGRESMDISRPCSSCPCMPPGVHVCVMNVSGMKKNILTVHKREFRVSDHPVLNHVLNLFSTLPHSFSHLIFISLYFHNVYLHIIHIYSSSLIKWNQRNLHRHCISISYNPLLSKSLLPFTSQFCNNSSPSSSSSFLSYLGTCISDTQIICPKVVLLPFHFKQKI